MLTNDNSRIKAALPEPANALCALAAYICDTPVAALARGDAKNLSLIGSIGLADQDTAEAFAYCREAASRMNEPLGDAPLQLVPGGPRASSKGKTLYHAAMPLAAPDGRILGALYIAGSRPKKLLAKPWQALKVLAHEAEAYLAFLHVAEEQKHIKEELELSDLQREHLLRSIPSILIGTDDEGRVTILNTTAAEAFGISAESAVGKPLAECEIPWDWECIELGVELCKNQKSMLNISEVRYTPPSGQDRFLTVNISMILGQDGQSLGVLFTATDVTDRKLLEAQLAQSQKLESIGQLAAGIAHEINTPIQYVGDNTRFLSDAFEDLGKLQAAYDKLLDSASAGDVSAEVLAEVRAVKKAADVEYLREEVPNALKQSLEGLERVAHIVQAMKEFSHPGVKEKSAVNLNHALENAITISKNQWKFVTEMVTNFDPDLPTVPCLPAEINQVFLNMIINATHAISEANKDEADKKGTITITTRFDKIAAEVWIADTGTGIPEDARKKIFDPFFTTKAIGQGTGQGLSMARTAVMDGHGGSIAFETELGVGTTFIIRLPLRASETEAELAA